MSKADRAISEAASLAQNLVVWTKELTRATDRAGEPFRALGLAVAATLEVLRTHLSYAVYSPMPEEPKAKPGRRAGGLARAAAMTPEARRAQARKAAKTRWAEPGTQTAAAIRTPRASSRKAGKT
jgi:hypothetical protein